MNHYDQREDLLAADSNAFGRTRGGAGDGQHGQRQGAPVEQRVQATLEADGGMLDTLIAMVERGPLWDGNVPSKRGRNELIAWGLAARVVVNGEEGYTAATYAGAAAFRAYYRSDTIGEATEARKRERT